MKFSRTMEEALNEQIKHELYSSYLYLAMSAHMDAAGLPGFAHWMRVQSDEERGHGMKFFEYITERGGNIVLQAIDQPPANFGAPLEMFERVLEHERVVTGLIHKLYEMAVHENDYATVETLQWFVKEQVEEERNATQIVDQLRMVGTQGAAVFMMDRQLAARS